MEASVGKPVESLTFRLLGSLELARNGETLKLPASRKVRALLGYLVLASRPVARSQICELLWDVPTRAANCVGACRRSAGCWTTGASGSSPTATPSAWT